ncbi:MAG TPA: MMPL family transporter [Minicystis sp.]|nr:MMPL family transporter [Minicystis sp.]
MFELLGPLVHRRRWLVLALSGLFLAGAIALLVRGGRLTSGSIRGLEADEAARVVERVTHRPEDTTFVAVFRDDRPGADAAALDAAVRATVAPLRADPRVLAVTTAADAGPLMGRAMVNPAARAEIALVSLKGDFKDALAAYPAVRARIRAPIPVDCTGRVPFMHDLDGTLEADLLRAELVSLPLALIVLLWVFRTAVAAALPVGVGALAVVGGIAIVLGLSHVTDIAQYTINVCSLIGLGVAIDYSLFTVSRYREELARGLDYPDALARAVATAGRVVAFSGLAVGTGLAGLLFFEGSYLRAMGIGGAIVVALAVVFALTFLPALLAVLGPRVHAGRLPGRRAPAEGQGFWHRTATWVMRRPVRVLLPTLGLLLFLGIPFLHLRLAAADVRVLSSEVEARRGYDALRAAFPDQAATRVAVAVRFPSAPALTPERAAALYDLTHRLAALPHVRKVESVFDPSLPVPKEQAVYLLLRPPPEAAAQVEMAKRLLVGDDVALLYAIVDAPPESEPARDVVRAVRATRAVADGRLLVGGESANDLDATAYILSRTPYAVALVVGVTFVVLFLQLGSVLLPLKAVAMNAVSIAGSFGALVWVFQDGHLFVREPRPLEPSLPVLLFCILFGLSMDYEVLMLSRMKETWDASRDNTHAVAEGLERTAGLITSAAAIMVAVFGAFALARVVLIQAVGLGMSLAVALDATLVRVLLVPATMRLFGDANWWAPRPLVVLRDKLGMSKPH